MSIKAVHVCGPYIEDWHEIVIPDEGRLAALQSLVGGLIEALPIADDGGATVFINEEGKLHRLPATALWTDDHGCLVDGVAGPFVVLGPTVNGEATSLTSAALACAKRYLHPIIGAPRMDVGDWPEA